jgi:hypothetical protein
MDWLEGDGSREDVNGVRWIDKKEQAEHQAKKKELEAVEKQLAEMNV